MLEIIRDIDRRIFNYAILKVYCMMLDIPIYLRLKTLKMYSYEIYYGKTKNILNEFFDNNGSDKGSNHTNLTNKHYDWQPHTYSDYYYDQFCFSRGMVRRVFECGLGSNNKTVTGCMGEAANPGASLRAWRSFFYDAEIFGADIDQTILFTEDRINTYYVDQTDLRSIDDMWNRIGCADFDLIIDDGLHTFAAGIAMFEGSFGRLRENALYIIEDVRQADIHSFISYFKKNDVDFKLIRLTRPGVAGSNNNLIVIRKDNK